MAGFKNLEDLVGDLEAGLQKLRAGKLEPEELTPLVDDARELCDRLVLLRFKAHEFAYELRRKTPEGGVDENVVDRQPVRPFRIGAAYQTSLIDAIEEVSREQAEQAANARRLAGTPDLFDAAVDPVMEEPPAKVEIPTKEEEPSFADIAQSGVVEKAPVEEPETAQEPEGKEVHQEAGASEEENSKTEPVDSPLDPLFNGVEEEPKEEPAEEAEVAAADPDPITAPEPAPIQTEPVAQEAIVSSGQAMEGTPSLAEQMERKPIQDLRTAFSLVEKYECIKGLFQDDALLFDKVLEALDGAGDYQLALHWLQQHVPESMVWDQEDPTVARFLERVQRRYI
ncbi:hypothetical protein OAO65_00355 [Flavobacteriales bacterium]|nr:hypothetical protein [Flavobacteriales bacterium]